MRDRQRRAAEMERQCRQRGEEPQPPRRFSLDIEVFAYVFAGDWESFLTIQQDLLLQIMDVIERAGTAIAFPSQTLHIAEGRVPVEHAQAASDN